MSNVADFHLRGASDARVLAVIVCLSVCVSFTRRHCIKTAKYRITQTTLRDSAGTLLTPRVVGGRPLLPPEMCAQSDTPAFRTRQFRPISAHSASTVRAGEKVQLALIGSRPRAFQRAIDEPCALPLSPPKGGTKRDVAVFVSKIQLLSKKYAKKFLCENFQRQSGTISTDFA